MLDERKTKEQLITEFRELRQRLIIFEQEQKKLKLSIVEGMRAENIMQARLRLLKFAESHSLEELTQATLDELEALTASTIGFYHLVEADQRTLSLQTWSANTLAHMCTAEGKGQHYEVAKAGVWVDCVHQRRPVIHNDYNALPHRKGMPPGHAPVLRELVVPIFRANKIVAIIGVGNKPSNYDEWDVEMVSLLGDLSWDISERKRAETALRDREAKYRAAVETSADGFCITDMAGRFLELNDSFAVHLGYSPDEMLSMSVPDIEAQLTPAEIVAAIDKVRREGRAIFETKHRTKEGRVCPVEVNLAYWPIAGGRMFVFVRDIAERKRAEEALRESREDLNRAQAVAHTGSWRMNVQKNELTWSEENHRIFEILPGTHMTYETFLSTVHPEDREYVDREWMAALKGEPYDIEHRIIVDGTVKWVQSGPNWSSTPKASCLVGSGRLRTSPNASRQKQKLNVWPLSRK